MLRAGLLKSSDTLPAHQPDLIVGGCRPGVINGSKMTHCANCNRKLSVAPSSQQFMETHNAPYRVVCLDCAMKQMKTLVKKART